MFARSDDKPISRVCAGYSLVEMLSALAVVALMSAMVATGVSAGARAYARAQFASQSEMLAATIDSALSDSFRFMYEDNGASAYVVAHDGRRVAFAKSSSPLVSKGGRIYLTSPSSNDVKLVNDGIYGSCAVTAVDMVACTMEGVEFSYTIEDGGSLSREFSFTASPLAGVTRDRSVNSGAGSSSGEPGIAADKAALDAEIALAEALDLNGSAPAAIEDAVRTALAAAKAVSADEGASEEEVSGATGALRAARLAYENARNLSGLDKDGLESAIAQADRARPWSGGSEAATNALGDAYDAAEDALEGAATQEEVDSAAEALVRALEVFLESKSSSGGDGGDDEPVFAFTVGGKEYSLPVVEYDGSGDLEEGTVYLKDGKYYYASKDFNDGSNKDIAVLSSWAFSTSGVALITPDFVTADMFDKSNGTQREQKIAKGTLYYDSASKKLWVAHQDLWWATRPDVNPSNWDDVSAMLE